MNTQLRNSLGGVGITGKIIWVLFTILLAFNISTAMAADDPYEGAGNNNNRTAANARTFTSDSILISSSVIAGADDQDWYSFSGAVNDSLAATLEISGGQTWNGKVTIYNSGGAKIAESDTGAENMNEKISDVILSAAGTYYVFVGLSSASPTLTRPASFTEGLYNLKVSRKQNVIVDLNEPNDSTAAATALSFVNNQADTSGYINIISDVDYFSLSALKGLTTRDSITITLTSTTGLNGKLIVYDSVGTALLTKDANGAGMSESISDAELLALLRSGSYTYYIAVQNSAGLTTGPYSILVKKQSVNVINTAPTASFTVSPSLGTLDTTFMFNASASTDPEGQAITYSWDFNNDGTYEINDTTASSVTYMYSSTGTKTIRLKVKDVLSLADSTTGTVEVNGAPTASFTVSPTYATMDSIFQVNASASTDPEGKTLTYSWDFNNDGTYEITDTTAATAWYQYATIGVKTIKLMVTDTVGLNDDTTMTVTVDGPPTASFTITPATGYTDTTFRLDASASSDPEAKAMTYSWDFDNNGVYEITDTTAATASWMFTRAGNMTVKLTVKDTLGQWDDSTRTIFVNLAGNLDPIAAFSVTPSIANIGDSFTFNASTSSDPEAMALTYSWDFNNDGTNEVTDTTAATAVWQYSTSGLKTIKLTVKDSIGVPDDTTMSVTVNARPTASFTVSPLVGGVDTVFMVNASASSDPEGAALRYSWDFNNDGTKEITDTTVATAQWQYSTLGTKTIKLTVTDSLGVTDDTTMTVTVTVIGNANPVASFTVTPDSGTTETTFAFNASASSDSEGTALKYSWDFNNDATNEITDTTVATASWRYTSAGTMTIKLTVTDSVGLTGTATMTVIVTQAAANQAPTATFTVIPAMIDAGDSITVTATVTDDRDPVGSVMVRWDWENDGTWDTNYSTTKAATHKYTLPGIFMIALEAKDTEGLTTEVWSMVTVNAQPAVPYTIPVTSDTGAIRVPFMNTIFSVKFESGTVAGGNVEVTAYGTSAPPEIPQAKVFTTAAAYYTITSTDITTFTATISFTYTDSLLNVQNLIEDSLLIAYYIDSEVKWRTLPTNIDTVNNIATLAAPVNHFSAWALVNRYDMQVVGVEEEMGVPVSFELSQNYPNPFNPTTNINYSVPKNGMVKLAIYNILGQEVITLVNEVKAAGRYSVVWDGISKNGIRVSTGVYIYRMTADGFIETKKMLLLK